MKVLASDLDGTLILENKIDPKDLEAIKKLRRKGYKFIISTGRTISGFDKVLEEHNLEFDYLVLCNGGVILDENKNIISNNTINHEVGMQLVNEYYETKELGVYIDDGESTALLDNPNKDYDKIGFLSDVAERRKDRQAFLDKKRDFYMMSIFSLDECYDRAERTKNIINEKYNDNLDVFRNQFFVDIVPKGCSKGNGLLKLAEILNIDTKNIYTVGDSFNDVSMFEITENSYTFNRAEEGIKQFANNKIDYVYEIVNEILA
ncbi:MAG: Cof-type HAD-IIB family hydrolase [Clostridium sp.]